jgi:hypothetical protein
MTSAARRIVFAAAGTAVMLGMAGCVTVPTAPAVMVLPGQYKPFDQFQADDRECRQYASAAIGAAGEAAANNATAQAVGSALVGAAVGAAIGSVSGQAGQGAAIGGGTGLLFGSAAGNNMAGASSYQLQQRYDGAYLQCMYAKGNQIPMRGGERPGYGSSPAYGNPLGTPYGAPQGGSQLPPPPPPQPRQQ